MTTSTKFQKYDPAQHESFKIQNIIPLFKGDRATLYDKPQGQQTGASFFIGETEYAMVDFDIKCEGVDEYREMILGILPQDGIRIVKTKSGGLHVYVKADNIERFYKNQYPTVYQDDNLAIDLFVPRKKDKVHLPLPGTITRE